MADSIIQIDLEKTVTVFRILIINNIVLTNLLLGNLIRLVDKKA